MAAYVEHEVNRMGDDYTVICHKAYHAEGSLLSNPSYDSTQATNNHIDTYP